MRTIAVTASATITVLELNAILAVAAASAIAMALPPPSHIIADGDQVVIRKASGDYNVTVTGGVGGSEVLTAAGDAVTYQWDKSTWTWVKIDETRQGALFPQVGSAAGAVALMLGATVAEGLQVKILEETIDHTDNTDLAIALTAKIPAGAVVLSAQANIESALTGGSTTVKVGLGIASDPDKYGKTSALTKNAKITTVPDWAVVASEETVGVYACATGGGAGDTALTVGSVRVRIVMLVATDLANAA